MYKEKMINKYIELNNDIIATINIKNKKISTIDGKIEKVFSYREFVEFIADKYDLNLSFIDEEVIALENLNIDEEKFEYDIEYKLKNGNSTNLYYNFIRVNEEEVFIFVKQNNTNQQENIDKMTKASPKSYIDNKAKSNMLRKTPFTIIYADIDNFRIINDEYGQTVGDMILIEMVSACKNFLGPRGAIARVGGDNFLIIVDMEDDYNKVHDLLFDLKQEMQNLPTCINKGIFVTLTLGSAQYPKDGEYELLLRKAKKAIIRGKNKGRDCFIMYLEEKCGKVTMDDVIDETVKKIDNTSTKNDIYSLILSVSQTLNSTMEFDSAIDKTLELVGNYFYIDRVSVARINIKTIEIIKHHSWYNPKISIKHQAYCVDEIIPEWGKALGKKNYIMIDDTQEVGKDYPLYDLFPKDSTTASCAFELVLANKSYGLIRFDMTTGKRHWRTDVFQALNLIAQLLATALQKNYIKETNYATLYLDPKHNCFNFTKLFSDVTNAIIYENIDEYSVMEVDLRNETDLRAAIGEKKKNEIVNCFVRILNYEKHSLYGKHHDGAFVIFFKHHDREKIGNLFNKIKEELNEFSKNNNLDIMLQAGVYEASVKNDRLVDSFENANLTRLINKTNDILYYSEQVKADIIFNAEMSLRIDEALVKNEFLLYLQPKISTKTGKLIGAEALTRWKYKGEKLLFPDTFIPVFEKNGVIEKLDYRVFENVCIYQKKALAQGINIVPISVNVSRYVEDLDSYIENMERIRLKYDLDPKYIEVEITEGMYFENLVKIKGFIDILHELGYKVSMDDFGSGYSNLVSLAKLDFDVIKFDKSFCMDLDNDKVKIMLQELIGLVKNMKMDTVCEGVETLENVEFLTTIGCDTIQGYYYSKPIPESDFYNKYYLNN